MPSQALHKAKQALEKEKQVRKQLEQQRQQARPPPPPLPPNRVLFRSVSDIQCFLLFGAPLHFSHTDDIGVPGCLPAFGEQSSIQRHSWIPPPSSDSPRFSKTCSSASARVNLPCTARKCTRRAFDPPRTLQAFVRSLVQEREAEVQAERELEEMRSSRRESELRQQLARRQVAALEEEEQQRHQQQDEDGDGEAEEEVDSEAAWTDALLSEVASGAAQCGACARVLEAWACRTDPSPPRRLAARTRCLNIRDEVMLCFFSTYDAL